ncbi:MAG: hypothetical protein LC128_04960 [Chitinophagales bacterium]|nr:hypothetical protein [Chitinophagales bacterium]
MSKRLKIFLSVLIGIYIFFLPIRSMQSDSLSGEEYGMMGEMLRLRQSVIDKFGFLSHKQEKDIKKILSKYLFIDLSYKNTFVYKGTGNDVRVDRVALTKLLRSLYSEQSKIRLVLCDVLLEESMDASWGQDPESLDDAAYDEATQKAKAIDSGLKEILDSFQSKKKILLPFEYNTNAQSKTDLVYPEINSALSQYNSQFNESFYRYSYITDHYRGIPVTMSDMLSGNTDTSYLGNLLGIGILKGQSFRRAGIALNRITPHFRITNEKIQRDIDYFLAGDFNTELMKGRDSLIVVIGNFENRDMHTTILHRMSGPLLLVNLYESLQKGDNFFEWWFILLSLIVYSIIGYASLDKLTKPKKHESLMPTTKKQFHFSRDKTKLSFVSEVLSILWNVVYFTFYYIRYQLKKNWVYWVLFLYILISLLLFNHYLYLLASTAGLVLLQFAGNLVKYILKKKSSTES